MHIAGAPARGASPTPPARPASAHILFDCSDGADDCVLRPKFSARFSCRSQRGAGVASAYAGRVWAWERHLLERTRG